MDFSPIQVSTQTFTVKSNIQEISLLKFYDSVVVETDLTKKGIQFVKYQSLKKGFITEKTKKSKKDKGEKPVKKNFLNCVTMVAFVDKAINIKFFKNGVFQLTGCKHVNHAIESITIIRDTLLKITDHFRFDKGNDDLIVYITSAMRNIDFKLGYHINRFYFFDYLVNTYKDDDNIVIPDAVGNKTDTKIKIRLTESDILSLPNIKLVFPSREQTIYYKDCIDESTKTSQKSASKQKDKFVTITTFQNGKILLSAADETVQSKYLEWFQSLIKNIENIIKLVKEDKHTFYIKKD